MGEFRVRKIVRQEVGDCPPCPKTCSCSKCSGGKSETDDEVGMVLVGSTLGTMVLSFVLLMIGSMVNTDMKQMTCVQTFWTFVFIWIGLLFGLAVLCVIASNASK